MTAGRGIVHGEMFPLLRTDGPNRLRLLQIWLNLPARAKLVDPHFVMHWAELIPEAPGSGGARATVLAGAVGEARGLPPPPNSWAADPANEVREHTRARAPETSRACLGGGRSRGGGGRSRRRGHACPTAPANGPRHQGSSS